MARNQSRGRKAPFSLTPQQLAREFGSQAASIRLGLSRSALATDAVLPTLRAWYAGVIQGVVCHVLTRLGRTRLASSLDADSQPSLESLIGSRPSIEETGREVESHLARYLVSFDHAHPQDWFKPLYHDLFPRQVRHALGEYYTPGWLAEYVLDQVGYDGRPHSRLLDPTCGSGTFLVAAIGRFRRAYVGQARTLVLRNIVGFDLNPLAVLTARANYLLAIADLLPGRGEIEIPVYLCDAILADPTAATAPFDYVVGNPPWIAWDNLPADYRQATRPLWERYGLFSLPAGAARHGGAKKDLAMLVLYASADRYLKRGGRLGMLVTQTVFQSKGAGDGFRHFRLGPDGDWLGVRGVDDLVAVQPFGNAANRTCVLTLEKGRLTQYPVSYVKWLPCGTGIAPAPTDKAGETPAPQAYRQDRYLARPVDPRQPGSPWFLSPEGVNLSPDHLLGRSAYTAHLGANTGGANAVYWLEVLGPADGGVRVRNLAAHGKHNVPAVEAVIEPDLLYPLVRWTDVGRYAARPSAYLLLAQDTTTRTGWTEAEMSARWPRTHAYLRQFEELLSRRAAYRRYQQHKPFYSMYNVGPYTIAPIKVVWRRMDQQIRAAVLEEIDDPWLGRRSAVPQETCVVVACDSTDEAHYICAALNSAAVHFLVTSQSVCGGKGFGTPSILDFIPLGRFDPSNRQHLALAAGSRQSHQSVAAGIQSQIDGLVAELWAVQNGG